MDNEIKIDSVSLNEIITKIDSLQIELNNFISDYAIDGLFDTSIGVATSAFEEMLPDLQMTVNKMINIINSTSNYLKLVDTEFSQEDQNKALEFSK